MPATSTPAEKPVPKQSHQKMRYVDIVKCDPQPRKQPEAVVSRTNNNTAVSSSCPAVSEPKSSVSTGRSSSAPAQQQSQTAQSGGHITKVYTHSRHTGKRRRNAVGAKHNAGGSNTGTGKVAR